MTRGAIRDAEAAVAACRRARARAELPSTELAHDQQVCRALRSLRHC